MYSIILVPLDGSRRAQRILPDVEELSKRFGATIVFLRVVGSEAGHGQTADFYIDALERALDEAKLYLSGIQGEFSKRGFQVRTVVERGPVVNTIINVAKREKVDLIAMASHGRTGLLRAFYGSVAAGVLNKVDRPILLIRADEDK
ncbi:MAG: universal stress protein [Anaerolineales bacterium]|jgi:nucleotide-binding universal stress UspA family protein|nr:universal stress protein [Anaerolineales bacterium]